MTETRSLRIAWVAASMGPGGLERSTALLANGLVELGLEVQVFTLTLPGGESFFHLDERVRLTSLRLSNAELGARLRAARFVARVVRVRSALQAFSPDLIVAFGDTTAALVLVATFGVRVPVVISERTVPSRAPLGRGWRILRRLFYPRAAAMVCQSQGVLGQFNWLPIAKVVIPNPVPAPELAASVSASERVRSRLIVGIGRFSAEKGFRYLIEGFSQVAAQFPEWKLLLVGEGALCTELKELAARICPDERVSFCPSQRDLEAIYRQATIVVSPSLVEGFPMVVCEAMSRSIPVIATYSGGAITEIIENGKSGVLINPGSADEIANALRGLITAPELQADLGRQASETVRRYSPDIIVQSWRSLIESLVES